MWLNAILLNGVKQKIGEQTKMCQSNSTQLYRKVGIFYYRYVKNQIKNSHFSQNRVLTSPMAPHIIQNSQLWKNSPLEKKPQIFVFVILKIRRKLFLPSLPFRSVLQVLF